MSIMRVSLVQGQLVGRWQSWDLLRSPGALSKYLSPGDTGPYLETFCLSQLGRSYWRLVSRSSTFSVAKDTCHNTE